MTASSAQKIYWPQLDGLRALAFFLVFFNHLELIPLARHGSIWLRLVNNGIRWGWVGVEIFFVLSGFLITTLLLEERKRTGEISFRHFFIRRLLRIWPLYYVTLIIGFILLPALNYGGMSLGGPEWLTAIRHTLLPYLFFAGNFCFARADYTLLPFVLMIAWSVCMEEQFYVVWGFLVSRIRQLDRLALIISGLLPATMMFRIWLQSDAESYSVFYYNTLAHLDSLLIGVGIALLHTSGNLPKVWLQRCGIWLAGVPVLGFIALMLFVPPLALNQPSIPYVMTMISLGGGLLLLSALYWPPASAFFSRTWMIRAGRLTYGMYLLHPLGDDLGKLATMWVFGSALNRMILPSWLLMSVLSLIFTILLAWLSWHLLEARFLKMKRRFTEIPSGFT